MIISPKLCIDDEFLSESSYGKIDTLITCIEALNEGTDDRFIVSTASSYTQSITLELLENVRDALLKLFQKILAYFNNYILNNVKLVNKYRDLVYDRFLQRKEPFIYDTYEYPELFNKNYPNVLSSSEFESKLDTLKEEIAKNDPRYDVEYEVDAMLISFGYDRIDGEVDPYDLKATVQQVVRDHIVGREVRKVLTAKDLTTFMDEIEKYKTLKDTIARTKRELEEDYKRLKKSQMKIFKRIEAQSVGLKDWKYPEVRELEKTDSNRFAEINMQLLRLFNGLITIYNETFSTKLNVLKAKIEENQQVITNILVYTKVYTSVSNKKMSHLDRRIQKFTPDLKT